MEILSFQTGTLFVEMVFWDTANIVLVNSVTTVLHQSQVMLNNR